MLVSCVGATLTGAEREKVAQAKRCAHGLPCQSAVHALLSLLRFDNKSPRMLFIIWSCMRVMTLLVACFCSAQVNIGSPLLLHETRLQECSRCRHGAVVI